MKPHSASMLNALALIVISILGYFIGETKSFTAFIPAIFGVILLALNPGVKKEHKVISHVAVVLTLVVLIALGKPLSGAINRGDDGAQIRITMMMALTAWALFTFIRSFINKRKERALKA